MTLFIINSNTESDTSEFQNWGVKFVNSPAFIRFELGRNFISKIWNSIRRLYDYWTSVTEDVHNYIFNILPVIVFGVPFLIKHLIPYFRHNSCLGVVRNSKHKKVRNLNLNINFFLLMVAFWSKICSCWIVWRQNV